MCVCVIGTIIPIVSFEFAMPFRPCIAEGGMSVTEDGYMNILASKLRTWVQCDKLCLESRKKALHVLTIQLVTFGSCLQEICPQSVTFCSLHTQKMLSEKFETSIFNNI